MKNLLEFFKEEEISLNDFLKVTKMVAFKLLIFIVVSLIFNVTCDGIKDYLLIPRNAEIAHNFVICAFIAYVAQAFVWDYIVNHSKDPEEWIGFHVVAYKIVTAILYIAAAIAFTYVYSGTTDHFIMIFAVASGVIMIINAFISAVQHVQYDRQQEKSKEKESTGLSINNKEVFYGDKVCTSDGVIYYVVKSVIYCKPTLCKVTERHWVADPWKFERMIKNHELFLIEN
jgi:hypothetical protein